MNKVRMSRLSPGPGMSECPACHQEEEEERISECPACHQESPGVTRNQEVTTRTRSHQDRLTPE